MRRETTPRPQLPEAGHGTDEHRILDEIVTANLGQLDGKCSYARDHTWIRVETESQVQVGTAPFVARIVGNLRWIVLLPPRTRIWKGRPCAWLDQPGGTLTLRSPLSGIIRERNEALCGNANFNLKDPLGSEWLYRVQPLRLRTERRQLLDAASYQNMLQKDFDAWQQSILDCVQESRNAATPTLADGGVQVRDLIGLLGAERVHQIAARFLR